MTTTDQFLLALQAYQEIRTEIQQEETPLPLAQEPPEAGSPVKESVAFPDGSLLLGLAEDGLPVLLDLYDPAPGPLLVAGDGGSGKTAFLQSVARASNLQDPGDTQFGVLTPFPEEWNAVETLPNCLGIWPAYHTSSRNFLARLVSWAETLPETRQTLLLLVDGLDLLTSGGFKSQHDLRWLLMYGPERQIWPVVSVNPGRLAHLQVWLEYFSTRVLGQVKQSHTASLLSNNPDVNLVDLQATTQYYLSQPDGSLKFWLPPLE